MLRTALRAARRALRRPAGAEPLGPHRAARGRAVPLAHRHRPAAHDQGRLRARHRRRHQHLPARAGRGRPARGAGRVGCRLMPPEPAPDPALHRRQHPGGDPARALRRAAARRVPRRPARRSRTCPTGVEVAGARSTGSRSAPGAAGSGSLRPRGPRAPRARSSSSATSPTCSPPRASPADFRAEADFTDVLAEDNPDWQIDLNDEVIGRWRGENGRAGDVTLVWGRPLVRGAVAATAELERRDRRPGSGLQRPLHPDRPRRPRGLRRRRSSCEVKLWSQRAQGARLREPLRGGGRCGGE